MKYALIVIICLSQSYDFDASWVDFLFCQICVWNVERKTTNVNRHKKKNYIFNARIEVYCRFVWVPLMEDTSWSWLLQYRFVFVTTWVIPISCNSFSLSLSLTLSIPFSLFFRRRCIIWQFAATLRDVHRMHRNHSDTHTYKNRIRALNEESAAIWRRAEQTFSFGFFFRIGVVGHYTDVATHAYVVACLLRVQI